MDYSFFYDVLTSFPVILIRFGLFLNTLIAAGTNPGIKFLRSTRDTFPQMPSLNLPISSSVSFQVISQHPVTPNAKPGKKFPINQCPIKSSALKPFNMSRKREGL